MSSVDALRGMPSALRLAYRSALLGLIATLVLAGFTGGVAANITSAHVPAGGQLAADQPDDGRLPDEPLAAGQLAYEPFAAGQLANERFAAAQPDAAQPDASPLANERLVDGALGSPARTDRDVPRPDGADANGHQPLSGRLTPTTTPVLLSKRAGGRATQPEPAAVQQNSGADSTATAFVLVTDAAPAADGAAVQTNRGRGPPARSLS
jgi:hypothetical protein